MRFDASNPNNLDLEQDFKRVLGQLQELRDRVTALEARVNASSVNRPATSPTPSAGGTGVISR